MCVGDGPSAAGHDSDNVRIKSIVKTANYVHARSPHNFATNESTATYGEWGSRRAVIPEQVQVPISRDRIVLHHYVVKSRAEFEEKKRRGNAMDRPRSQYFWQHIELEMEHVFCPEMTFFSP